MITRRDIPAALAGLAVYFMLVMAFPSVAIAQDPENPEENPDTVCGRCTWSDDIGRPWPSQECQAGLPAVSNFPDAFCVTWDGPGGSEYCRYNKKKGCDEILALADDLEAVGKVMKGDVLPPHGNHFFLVEADGAATIMRKCDRSVVARIPAEQLAVAGRRRSAIRVG